MGEKYNQLTWEKRLHIEALYQAGIKVVDIATQIGVHYSTVYREIKRGKTIQRNSDWTEREIYSPNLGQDIYEKNKKECGRKLKIGNDYKFLRFVENKIINERYSPAAVLGYIKVNGLEFDTDICLTTLYNYIKGGIFLNVTMAECPYRKPKKKQKKQKVQKKLQKGTSIDKRPKDILTREEYGHWEMDSVVGPQGKSSACLLVLTERKTRNEIIEKVKDHTSDEVVRVLDKIERKLGEKVFREKFKTITVDNGTEFSDWEGMERSRRNKKNRTEIFYCHPYRSCERGSNENNNKLIRRWYPKGESFDNVSREEIKKVEDWINSYPRLLFNWQSSDDMARQELSRRECM